jgi:hypothetical protein
MSIKAFTQVLRWLPMLLIGAVLELCSVSSVRADFEFEPSWAPAEYAAVRDEIKQWQKVASISDEEEAELSKLWPETPDDDDATPLLDRLAKSFAVAHPEAADLVRHCDAAYKGPALPEAKWLTTADLPPLVRHNLRLYYARWLAQYGLYDEVLEQIDGLRPADVVDPAALLFYQMAAHHQLVQPEEARAALVQLMEREDELPRRYQQVAQLVQRDLAALDDESLDHIARRMRDIRRRLGYGRAGEKVQAVEQGVLDSLDKKIKDLEKQQQQQQSSAAAGGSSQSQRPMEESRPAELKAPMQVDRKNIGHQSGWGDLPPKEREQALQAVGREFPAHYRDIIADYFRELAAEPEAPPAK